MAEEWQREQRNDNRPVGRIAAVTTLLTELEANDAAYLSGGIERDKWLEVAKGIDDKLAVAGLRLAVRPWRDSAR